MHPSRPCPARSHAPGPRSGRPAAVLLLGAALLLGAPAAAQERTVEAAREQQQRFEQYRQSRIPVQARQDGARCDERIGRICIWFGGAEEERFPPEPPETEQARRGLIGVLLETRGQDPDPWVDGQLVHYLVEQRDFAYAEAIAEECPGGEAWWCSALLGYSLHVRGAWVEAEEAFRAALETMPEEERRRWTDLDVVAGEEAQDALDDAGDGEAAQLRELFWTLSDPLLTVPGNDRLTDHFARWVVARNREEAENPQGLLWDRDLEETLVRYGRLIGWSRTHDPGPTLSGGRFDLRDTRRVIGHHDPMSRGYLFPGRFLTSPSEIPPESWITAPREARTWYAPPYAPDTRALETQVGRFRRGAEMLVVGAYRPAGGEAEVEGGVQAGLFLVPVDGGPPLRASGLRTEDVLTLRAEPGEYVSSLELFAPEGEKAWRARQGVRQAALFPGQVSLSDLLLLREGAPRPETLEDALPHVRPGVRVRLGERFTVVWEAYGLEVDRPVGVTLGFTRGRPGFLERVGAFLGVVEPEEPVEITFEDAAEGGVQAAFRALELELPELEPGEYTLHLRLDLPEGEPVVTSRPIVVEGG